MIVVADDIFDGPSSALHIVRIKVSETIFQKQRNRTKLTNSGLKLLTAFAKESSPPTFSSATFPLNVPAIDLTILVSFEAEKSKKRAVSMNDIFALLVSRPDPPPTKVKNSLEKSECEGLCSAFEAGLSIEGKSCTQIACQFLQ